MSYYFTLNYPPTVKPCSVSELLRRLLIPRKWRHYLRTEHAILINGHYRYFNKLVLPGDKIKLTFNHVNSSQGPYSASGHLPDVIYEDDNLLVINKPAGQKTHPNQCENNTALNDCATYLKHTPFIVHRLDMLTSGLLLIAKNPVVVPILNRELVSKDFHREYVAVVQNIDKLANAGSINLPIGHDENDQRKRIVRPDGQASLTRYQVLKHLSHNTGLVKLSLETGRTHQIRVHLAAKGSPIIGDPLYNPAFSRGQFLHLTAYQLSFIKPFSFDYVQIKLPRRKIQLLN